MPSFPPPLPCLIALPLLLSGQLTRSKLESREASDLNQETLSARSVNLSPTERFEGGGGGGGVKGRGQEEEIWLDSYCGMKGRRRREKEEED